MHNPVSTFTRGKPPLLNMVGLLGLAAVVWVGSIGLRSRFTTPEPTATPTSLPPTVIPSSTNTPLPTLTPTATEPVQVPTETPEIISDPLAALTGLMVFSMSDGYYTHLFAYHPQILPVTRLTDDPWDDRQPSISPDGSKIAFSSRRNGYWDIYILDLTTADLIRVSDNPQYDGAPSWSPDGQWLAYETYLDSNLEIVLQFLGDLTQPPVRLTSNPSADHSPKWSPQGRQIAFVSNITGDDEIWLANLDQIEGRFVNISRSGISRDLYPAWSSDGRFLAWSGQDNGIAELLVTDLSVTESQPRLIGSGLSPVWSPDDSVLAAVLSSPDGNSLVGYRVDDSKLILPPAHLPGTIQGMDWKAANLPIYLPANLPSDDSPIPLNLFQVVISDSTETALGRFNLVMIEDVNVPYPFIQDSADESFNALRTEVARQSGWDLLGDLENAFLPITEPPHPGLVDEWLFTGRAFALVTSPVQAGWMVTVRENYSGLTYWRVWIRTRYQDGSQGEPLRSRIWDLDARTSGDNHAYEQGGEEQPAPTGYWLDLTELAARFGWTPIPALTNWRTYYPASRFNQFVFAEGLDLNTAMEQIYPPEAVNEPFMIPSQTVPALFSQLPENNLSTPQPDNSSEGQPTLRPTWTPVPGN